MKKVLIFASAIVFLACKKDIQPDYAIISGKITNKPVGAVTINSLNRSFSESIEFTEDGSFSDTLALDNKSYVLYDGQNPIFIRLEAGDKLNINYDASDFENTLSITGVGSEVSNYIMARKKTERRMFGNANETYTLNESDFKSKFTKIKDTLFGLLNNTSGLSKEFVKNEKRNIRYFYLKSLMDYEGAHRYFTKNESFQTSDDFLKEFVAFDYSNEEDYVFSDNYKRIVSNHFVEESRKLAEKDSLTNDLAFVKITSTNKSEVIKNDLLFEFANFNMSYSSDIKVFYDTFMANSTNQDNNEIITEKYKKLTALAKGNVSPKFENYENYKGGTTSLVDLKGKYVYVDVWATWCGPCIREIPALKEIEKQYHGKNIEFVSVSIDKLTDHDKWTAMVADKALSGTQLMADNDWNSNFVKEYQIQGIPRFILIDPEGKIVDHNAPRPSDPTLEALFQEENI
ncbi:thioredoxin-like domain-containing protein [uncultured Algibacter sp.]|uniref:redoxin family protein n=1 Tax=uncultured Algibacter sp. TaxID=298659 RepID=UPI00262CBA84|nr:thioredoxin-like domain-containing protein [uncultured Algibacter sp.]